MTLSYRSALTALVLAGLGLTATAHAQTTQYSSRASFNTAAGGLTTFTFDGYAPPNGSMLYPTGLTVNGAGFTATGADGLLFVDSPGSGFGDPFGGHQYLDTDNQGTLTVALPAGTMAFGADFSNYDVSTGATLTALVNGVAFTFAEPGSTSAAFAGFTSSVPITSLSFSGGNLGVAVDNVSFTKAGPPAAVPEPAAPASFAVGILGLAGLVVAARRRKQAAPGL